MPNAIDDNEYVPTKSDFFNEATFYVFGHVNRHKVRMWGSGIPHDISETYIFVKKLRLRDKRFANHKAI